MRPIYTPDPIMFQSFDDYLRALNPAFYVPLSKMSKGTSGNLLTNASFEDGDPPTGWAVTGTGAAGSRSTEQVFEPTYSAKMISGSAVGYFLQYNTDYLKYAGITASLTGEVFATDANAARMALDDGVATYSTYHAGTGIWIQGVISKRISAMPSFLRASCRMAATSLTAYYDKLNLTVPQMLSMDNNGYILHPDVSSSNPSILDGVDDLITSETDPAGTNGYVNMATIKPTGWGGSNSGRIVDNGKILLFTNSISARLNFRSDGSTVAYSADNSIALNKTYRIVVFRAADGTANFFINGALSGAANQASGTPTSGTTLLTIGNRAAGDRSFAGSIPDLEVLTGAAYTRAAANMLAFAQNDYAMALRAGLV